MHIRTVSIAMTVLLAAGSQVSAQGWTISDLGQTATREECMQRAQATADAYTRQFGAGYASSASWTHYLYDVQPGVNHVVFMCPFVNGVYNVFLVTHGATSEDNRTLVHDRMEQLWDQPVPSPSPSPAPGTGK